MESKCVDILRKFSICPIVPVKLLARTLKIMRKNTPIKSASKNETIWLFVMLLANNPIEM